MEENRLVSLKEAASILGVARQTLYNRCAPGAGRPFPVRSIRIGASIKFNLKHLLEFMERGERRLNS